MIYLIIFLNLLTPTTDTTRTDTVKKWNYPITRAIIKDSTRQEQTIQKLDDILKKLKKK